MTFQTVQIQNDKKDQVIIEGLRDQWFTIFGATSNVGKIFVGPKGIDYSREVGWPITPLSDTIGLSNYNRFFVTKSDDWYMSGLKGDILYVILEDDPTKTRLDLIIELLTRILESVAK